GGMSDVCPVSDRPAVGGCPVGYTNRGPVAPDDDCNDSDSAISPAATERCDMRDNDCDSSVDETVSVVCYTDGDGDTFARSGAPPVMTCAVSGRPEVGGCPGGM